jgi:hypothetical protein
MGGQTGEGSSAPAACQDAETKRVAVGAKTSLGFSAEELLQRLQDAEAPVTGRFSQQEDDDAPDSGAGSSDGSEVSVSVHFEARGKAEVVTRTMNYGKPVDCAPRLDVPVTVQLTALGARGEFHAEFPSVLEAYSTELATLWREIPRDTVEDTLLPALDSNEQVESYWLGGRFSPHAQSAELQVRVGPKKRPQSDEPTKGGQWPDRFITWSQFGQCAEFGLQVPGDAEVLGFKAGTAHQLLPTELPLTWQDGSTTTLHLQATAVEGAACLEDPCYGSCPSGSDLEEVNDRAGLLVPIEVKLFTDDGRWDTTLRNELSLDLLHSGAPGAVAFGLMDDYATADEVKQQLGIELQPWSSDKAAELRFELISDNVDDRHFRGSLQLVVSDPECRCIMPLCDCYEQAIRARIGERDAEQGDAGVEQSADAGN